MNLLYCNKCKKEVVMYSIPPMPGAEEEINKLVKQAEKEGKLVILNAPQFGTHHCPICGEELIEKS